MKKNNISLLFTRFGTLLMLLVIFISFCLFIEGFASPKNLMNILRQISLLAIIAEGFTMCLIVNEMDLSFANVACLCGIVSAGLVLKGHGTFAAVVVPLLIGLGFGIASGLLVTMVGISSLITTLAMGILATGLTYWYTGGISLYGTMPQSYLILGRGYFAGIPSLIVMMIIVVIVAHIFVNRTKAGIHLQATGANREAAKLSGINTDLYRILALTICGLGAALTGILLTSRLGAGNPEAASGYMMDTFAAALLGTTVLHMGLASPIGTIVGALMIGILNNGMTLAGAQYYMQDVTKALIIILSVSIASSQAKRLDRN
ncbi:MAG: ABC transporter permease [Spirochaetales bacterium]|nr:ABC transporter permease [Spirochaetales bacterium]